MKFIMKDEKRKVEIEVLGRTHPDALDYWDGNWVTSFLHVEIPGFQADFMADLRTDEFQQFRDELKTMRDTLKGKAKLIHMEEAIQLEGVIDPLGMVWWKGRFCHPVGDGAVLTFDFNFDQTYLHGMIKDLNDILYEFPVIGKP